MATDAATLKGLIKDNIISYCGWDEENSLHLDCLAEAIATAVVNHIKSSATVTVDSGSSAGTYQVE